MPFPRHVDRFHLHVTLELTAARAKGGSHATRKPLPREYHGEYTQARVAAHPTARPGADDRAEYMGACRPHVTQGAQRSGGTARGNAGLVALSWCGAYQVTSQHESR